MKVNIGPYKNPLSTHKLECLYLEYMYGDTWYNIGEKDHKWHDRMVLGFLQSIDKYILKRFRRPRKEQVMYHKHDTWSLDHTLAIVILPGLKQLRDTNHGFSTVDNEDVPEHLRSEEKDEWGCLKNGEARWLWVMDEMIWAFTQIAEDYPADFSNGGLIDYKWEKLPTGGSQLNKGPNHTYSVDHEAQKSYHKRIDNGTKLFGKYFRSLWD